jgi:hypothetical protein
MTDLTLNEFKGLSEEKLRQILKEEARIICGPDLLKNNFKDTGKNSILFADPNIKKRKTLPPPACSERLPFLTP